MCVLNNCFCVDDVCHDRAHEGRVEGESHDEEVVKSRQEVGSKEKK